MSDSPDFELWGAEARNSSVDSWVAGVIRSLADDVGRECLNLLLSFLPLHVSFSLGRTRGLSGVRRSSQAHREPILAFELPQVYHIGRECARGFVKKSEKNFEAGGRAFCWGFCRSKSPLCPCTGRGRATGGPLVRARRRARQNGLRAALRARPRAGQWLDSPRGVPLEVGGQPARSATGSWRAARKGFHFLAGGPGPPGPPGQPGKWQGGLRARPLTRAKPVSLFLVRSAKQARSRWSRWSQRSR